MQYDKSAPDNSQKNQTTTIGVIGGTGLYEFQTGDCIGDCQTPFGNTSTHIVQSVVNQKKVAFLARHGNPHTIVPHKINYRANLWALKQLGVKSVLAVNAVGGIHPDLSPGSLVIPDQLIDYTHGREHTYYDGTHTELLGSALEHIDFTTPFTPSLRSVVIDAANNAKIPVIEKGVYAVTQGPRLESPAEINRLERDGSDIVGMTSMPEAALARELSMDYVSICLVVNPAAGRSDRAITMQEIHQVLENTMTSVRQLLKTTVTLLP